MALLLESSWAYVLVFLLSAVPFIEAVTVIPIAIIAGLSSVPVVLLAFSGNFITMLLVILLADKIKRRRMRKKGKGVNAEVPSKRSLRAREIWRKYGLPGLAFIGPLLIGSHLAALMSISLGGTKKMTTIWMTASVAFWCILIAVLAHLGYGLFN